MHHFVIAALLGFALAQSQDDAQTCAQKCTDAMNACRRQPGANMSTCQSNYFKCLGYIPSEGITPTTCVNSNIATPTSTQPIETGQPDQCAKKCTEAYNMCRGKPGANMATCGSDFAHCLGYNPPNNYPLSCRTSISTSSASAMPTSPPVEDECVKKCNAAMYACRTQPGANQSYCSSEYASCLGYNPYRSSIFVTPTACSASGVIPTGTGTGTGISTGTSTPPVVAGGSQLSPAYAAMALGVLAVL